MFYSRPKIEPLGWDLVSLPIPNGSRNFDGLTSDRRPIDFRFSSGWLTVERGAAGAPQDDSDMETVLSIPISPFGAMDIQPEQLCDILGLTVNGRKVAPSGIGGLRGFDWSGRTTYWISSHLMMPRWDAEILTKEISQALPGSILVQPSWEKGPLKVRCRQIKFLMESDVMVTIGVGYHKARLERMLAAEEVPTAEFESVFAHTIEIIRADHEGEDPTGRTYIDSRGAGKLGLDYEVLRHRRYRIRMQYLTEDTQAQSIMQKLLAKIDGHFCRGLQIVNLQTGAIIAEDLSDEEDTKSYSRNLRDWCLERPRRYLSVGINSLPNEGAVFVGMRPIA
jgi:hypothetical protein